MTGRMRLIMVVVLGVAAAVAISGSRGRAERDDSVFRAERARLDAALAALDARIGRLPALVIAADDSIDPAIVPAHLRGRRDLILARLDSMESVADERRRGAMAGLRASVADLEYRVDLAELALAGDVACADSLIAAWITDTDHRLTLVERQIVDSAASLGYIDPLRDARDEMHRIDERFTAMRKDGAGDVRPRHALGRDLALLRREVRAAVRSIRES